MKKTTTQSSGGIGVTGALGIVFVTLKLLKVIDWSWWYVTMPFWGVIAVLLAIFIVAGMLFLAKTLIESIN